MPQTKTQPPFNRKPTVPFKTNSKGQATVATPEQHTLIMNIANRVSASEGANLKAYLSLAGISVASQRHVIINSANTYISLFKAIVLILSLNLNLQLQIPLSKLAHINKEQTSGKQQT